MASHHLNPFYAIKECMACGSLYTRECCSIGSLGNKILVPEPESSPCCAKCGTPVDGPYCRGCALLRKNFKEDFLTYCGENETSKDFEDISKSSDDNTNVVNAPQEPIVVNQDSGEKSSQGPPQIDQNCCYECGDSLDGIFCRQCICKSCDKGLDPSCFSLPHVSKPNLVDNPPNIFNLPPQTLPIVHPTCNYENENSFIYNSKPHSSNDFPSVSTHPPQLYYDSSGFDHPQPPQDSVDCQEALDKILEELEEIKRDQRMLKELKKRVAEEQTAKENMSEKIDEEYERYCEIRIGKLKQDSNEWGSEVPKKEQAYEEEKYSAARRYMLSITCDDEDDSIPLGDIIARYSMSKAITPALPSEEPEDSLIIEDEHLDTILETELDEFIKSSVENLVQNPSESTDLSDGESECDVPINDDSPESHFTSFSNPLFDSNDDFSSDDESLSEEEIQKDEFKYFSNPLYDLDDEIITNEKILPNQKDLDVVIPIPPGIDKHCFNAESDLLESLLNHDSTPPGVESDYDSEGDVLSLEELLNNDYVPLAEYNQFTFDIKPDTVEKNDLDEQNEDECFDPGGGENVVFLNVEEDDSFIFTIYTFLPFVTYPEVSPLLSSTKNEDTIFDSVIST
ncbi:hypothetical protein Tco_1024152 [Tanacetum coccineum]